MTPEGRVKAGIKKRLDAKGLWRAGAPEPKVVRGFYYMPQNMGMGVNGIPDFVGSYNDAGGQARPFAIEAKAPGGKPTQVQLDRHAEMLAAGWLLYVIDDVSKLSELEAHLG